MKITVVGAGKVGSTVTQLLAMAALGEVVLVNRTAEKAQGIALDLQESGVDVQVTGTGRYQQTAGSDLMIITAGLPRKEGMSRDELLRANAGIVTDAAKQLARHSPDAVMIVVTNPLDVMAAAAWKASHFPPKRVVGMAGALDSSRFRSFIAQELGVSVRDVQALVLGSHGDLMVPLPRLTTVRGIPLPDLLPAKKIAQLVQRTVDAGAEIIALEKDSAFYAPAAAVVEMVEAILLDRKRIVPCSTLLRGEFGIKGVFLGVPVVLGHGGVERIVDPGLTVGEKRELQAAGRKVAAMAKGV
ncbi:MAG: malate dehydrogenase [Candidatus Aenigmarchaeota archaeon]|nr:malate dehydrogenase [Candidatus Aenigmarchaeota archaeon]